MLAQCGQQSDVGGEAGDVVGYRDGATGEAFFALIAYRQRGALTGLAQRMDVMVFVDDGVANDQHLHLRQRADMSEEILQWAAFLEALQKQAGVLRQNVEMIVQQLGGAEGDLVGEIHFAAVLAHRRCLARDVAAGCQLASA